MLQVHAVDFSADGVIKLGSTVTSLGNLDDAEGTVEYDGAGQSVLADDYYNLELGGTGTATAAGNVTCNGTFTLQNTVDKYRFINLHTSNYWSNRY